MFRFRTLFFCLLVAGVLFAFASAASAQVADVYPVLDGGVIKVKVETAATAEGVADTASVSIIQTNAAAGEVQLNCAPDVGPGQSVLFTNVVVENPGAGSPGTVKARAFSAANCEGDLYEDSANTAIVRFVGPAAPSIVDPASGPADIDIP